MIDFEVKGAIFDLDDTLLDNEEHTGNGLHERSRLLAAREMGATLGIEALANYTAEANAVAFRRAKVQTLESAFWYILVDTGIVQPGDTEFVHELAITMAVRKNELHDSIILNDAKPLPDAPEFVRALVDKGVRVAIASTAILRHINIFLSKAELSSHFPAERVISFESIMRPKPDPEVYNLAFASLGLPEADRSHTCAFDDDPRGIASARAAGLYVCGIASRHSK